MGTKRNASVGMFYLYTMIIVTGILILSSCGKRTEVKEFEDVRSIEVVDIHGDTIRITGGATCHLDKKIK